MAVQGVTLRNSYPIEIAATAETVDVAITGGVGAVPICCRNIDSPDTYTLYEKIGTKLVALDQSVHGNDFWQTDFDAASKRYAITFNLPLDGKANSTWVFTKRVPFEKKK